MVKSSKELWKAARGMAAIAAATSSVSERASLAYLALYACGYAGRGTLNKFDALGSAVYDTAFVARLVREIPDSVSIAGWTITGWDEDRVFLQKDKIRTAMARSHVEGQPLVTGQPTTLRMPAISPAAIPGFVMRAGDAPVQGHPVSRLYLNIRPTAAAWVLGALARTLDGEHLPYMLKVLAHPRAYLRRDACVIYVISEHLGKAFAAVCRCLSQTPVSLNDPVPLFTKKLASGVGFADDPSDLDFGEQSHGQWVSRLFLRATAASTDACGIAHAVMDEVRACGRDPLHPYLRAGRLASASHF